MAWLKTTGLWMLICVGICIVANLILWFLGIRATSELMSDFSARVVTTIVLLLAGMFMADTCQKFRGK